MLPAARWAGGHAIKNGLRRPAKITFLIINNIIKFRYYFKIHIELAQWPVHTGPVHVVWYRCRDLRAISPGTKEQLR